jgi:hypothetical protein
MRFSGVIAAFLALPGAFWAPAAMAASDSADTLAWPLKLVTPASITTQPAAPGINLNLGGTTLPSLAEDPSTLGQSTLNLARGFELQFAQDRNWNAYGDLFPATVLLSSTYLSGTSTYAGVNTDVGGVNFDVGYTALGMGALSENQPSMFARDLAARLGASLRSLGTVSANINWNFNDWGGLAITASQTNGDVSLLGVFSGSLATMGGTESTALGISARMGFGEGWVTTVTYGEGVTQLDLSRDSLFANSDPLRSDAYGIALAKQGLFGNDALGIAISRPLQLYTSSTNFGGGLNSSFLYANSQARESDVALGYVTTFLDGALALQANAAYQLNAAGTKGQNAVTGVARAKINF